MTAPRWQNHPYPGTYQTAPIWLDREQRFALAVELDDQLHVWGFDGLAFTRDELARLALPKAAAHLAIFSSPERGLGVYWEAAGRAHVGFAVDGAVESVASIAIEGGTRAPLVAGDPTTERVLVVTDDARTYEWRAGKWQELEPVPSTRFDEMTFVPGLGFVLVDSEGNAFQSDRKGWKAIARAPFAAAMLVDDGVLHLVGDSGLTRYDARADAWSEPVAIAGWEVVEERKLGADAWANQPRIMSDRKRPHLHYLPSIVIGSARHFHEWATLDVAARTLTPGPLGVEHPESTAINDRGWVVANSRLLELTRDGLEDRGKVPLEYAPTLQTDGTDLWLTSTGRLAKRTGDGWTVLSDKIGGPVGGIVISLEGDLVIIRAKDKAGKYTASAHRHQGKAWKATSKFPVRYNGLATRVGESWVLLPDRSSRALAIGGATWTLVETKIPGDDLMPYLFFFDAKTGQLVLGVYQENDLVLWSLDAKAVWREIARLGRMVDGYPTTFDPTDRSIRSLVRGKMVGDYRLPLGELLDATGVSPYVLPAPGPAPKQKTAAAKKKAAAPVDNVLLGATLRYTVADYDAEDEVEVRLAAKGSGALLRVTGPDGPVEAVLADEALATAEQEVLFAQGGYVDPPKRWREHLPSFLVSRAVHAELREGEGRRTTRKIDVDGTRVSIPVLARKSGTKLVVVDDPLWPIVLEREGDSELTLLGVTTS